ncbi:MAG: transglycosylase domain-containing protein [Anaeroplasmataceae bacterium]
MCYKIFKILSSIILVILLAFTLFYISSINNYDLDFEKFFPSSSVKIYDSENNLLHTEGIIKRTYVSSDKISPYMKEAIISIEDKDFYLHNGVSYKGILRATFKNIKSLKFKEGASTITQQLIKNTHLKNEKSLKRKINEIDLALKVERFLTKDQILEAYLNNILYGNKIYGIYEASWYYFNKDPINLNIEESAMLAGLIQLPNYYNPYKNYNEALEKRNIVINKMYEQGYISFEEMKLASRSDIILNNQPNYESYLDMFYDYLYEYIDENDINYNTNITISINKDIQHDIYDILNNKMSYFKDDLQNASVVVIDNSNTKIIGIGTSRALKRGSLNYATTPLQPGSTIKPILDYAPAFEYLNLSPASIILDEPYSYSNGESINNWDYSYKGYITLRKALASSRNIPALKLFLLVGSKNAFEFASRLNLVSELKNESEAIGGSLNGYSLLDITNAYTAFARMGYYKKASPILKIDNKEYITKDTKAMKDSTAFLINSILHDVFKYTSYDLKNRFLSAKTGQTNFDYATKKKYNYDNSRVKDSLCIGYTKDLTVGVWTGYNNNKYALTSESKEVSKKIMYYILDKYAKYNLSYEVPDNLVYIKVTNVDDILYLSNNGFYDYFIKGSEPLISYEEYINNKGLEKI